MPAFYTLPKEKRKEIALKWQKANSNFHSNCQKIANLENQLKDAIYWRDKFWSEMGYLDRTYGGLPEYKHNS